MIGTHAVAQIQCPVCTGTFLIGDVMVMRVVALAARVDSPDGPAIGVFTEYLHDYCQKKD